MNAGKKITQGENNPIVFQLSEVVCISEASELLNELKKIQNNKHDYLLDGSKIISIDTTALQLLIVFITQIKSYQKEVNWIEPSAALLYASKLSCLEKELNIRHVAH